MDSEPEFLVIGLTCCIVGIFLLANSIVFRSARRLVDEYFGVGTGSMRPLRDYVLNKIQVVIGFLFLTAGFILQMMTVWGLIGLEIKIVCGILLGFAAGVYLVGASYSRHSFQKILRAHFRQHPYDFPQNMSVTKQIGKVFGITESPDDSVEDYVAKVRFALGLNPRKDPPGEEAPSASQRIREMAPLPMPSRRALELD